MDVFAVIPARGGSNRIENKNIRDVGGKPLIAHTIEQANNSDIIDKSIVSTDDSEIRDVAVDYGAEAPFIRPKELATDTAKSPPVIDHALEWALNHGFDPDMIVKLQVTSPLRTVADIDNGIGRLSNRDDAQSIVSVTEFDTPLQWAVEIDDEQQMIPHSDETSLWAENVPRSQAYPSIFHPNGALSAANVGPFRENVSFYLDRTLAYEMPPERSIDIDELYELELVDKLL
jgi:N-acylneuraminate cytidylyltransferase